MAKLKEDIDEKFMQAALLEAKKAMEHDEVPIGAVLVKDGEIIARGFNQSIKKVDPTSHAEIEVLRKAAHKLSNYRLLDTTLYVTLEPCSMCVGAMLQARIKRVVFGAYDAKAGAVSSVFQILDSDQLNHTIEYRGGVLMEEGRDLLQYFFQERR